MRSGRVELGRAREQMAEATAHLEHARSTAALLGAAFEIVPLGVVIYDQDGMEVFRNRAAAALVDARHGDALAAHLLATLVEEARERGPRSRTIELAGPPARVMEVRVQVLPAVGPVAGSAAGSDATVATIQDVSERHQLDAVRRDFVANVSHELRTPVGALGALAEALGHEDDPEVMRRLGTRISAEAERAAGLIADLLDLSRVEGARRLESEPVVVAQLVTEALGRVRAAADERAILIREGPIDHRTRMVCDPAQIVSALANLLDNAVKYSDPGSHVDLRVATGDARIVFVVQDHGIGIPPRDHERIFERFYRVDRARSRETGGTGLGLAIVRHVALNHGGQVTVESREGEGSIFSLSLPLEEP
jgi:two-component system sensor histidine kinase SenX3